MNDTLQPDEEMLFSLATELGLVAIVITPETDRPKADSTKPPSLDKGAILT
jgi:hypothetical protein